MLSDDCLKLPPPAKLFVKPAARARGGDAGWHCGTSHRRLPSMKALPEGCSSSRT